MYCTNSRDEKIGVSCRLTNYLTCVTVAIFAFEVQVDFRENAIKQKGKKKTVQQNRIT